VGVRAEESLVPPLYWWAAAGKDHLCPSWLKLVSLVLSLRQSRVCPGRRDPVSLALAAHCCFDRLQLDARGRVRSRHVVVRALGLRVFVALWPAEASELLPR